jgi:hypothetical protein
MAGSRQPGFATTTTGVAGDGPRAFGSAADLDLDFVRTDRATLVTALLARCVTPHDAGHWWSQSVGARTAALLRVLEASDGVPALNLASRCGACGEAFEFELPLAALVAAETDSSRPLNVTLPGRPALSLRRPTGGDLLQWRHAGWTSRRDAVRLMLEALRISGPIPPPDDEPALAAALATLDPLVAFTVDCRCPQCDAAQSVSADLEGMALSRLASRQDALLHDVHRLASRYGWSEAEVLAVPASRRRRYLALIEAQE